MRGPGEEDVQMQRLKSAPPSSDTKSIALFGTTYSGCTAKKSVKGGEAVNAWVRVLWGRSVGLTFHCGPKRWDCGSVVVHRYDKS